MIFRICWCTHNNTMGIAHKPGRFICHPLELAAVGKGLLGRYPIESVPCGLGGLAAPSTARVWKLCCMSKIFSKIVENLQKWKPSERFSAIWYRGDCRNLENWSSTWLIMLKIWIGSWQNLKTVALQEDTSKQSYSLYPSLHSLVGLGSKLYTVWIHSKLCICFCSLVPGMWKMEERLVHTVCVCV